ncbi:hypothetical protein GF362_01645 [Candidatus Dojkabacteria bacterium]|nr:hypothetical protein [Candidatus Dojkabacteria bacterium]
MNYIIDSTIISIFLKKAIDSKEVQNFLDSYEEKVTQITSQVIYNYLSKEGGMNDKEIEGELNKFVDSGEDPPTFFQPEVLLEIDKQIEKYNESIYAKFEKQMSLEDQKRANDYIQKQLQLAQKNFEKMRQAALEELDEVEKEFAQIGRVRSWEEKQRAENKAQQPQSGQKNKYEPPQAVPKEQVNASQQNQQASQIQHKASIPTQDPVLD